MKPGRLVLTASLVVAGICGCGIEIHPSPPEAIDLNGVFGMAPVVDWIGDSVVLTDEAQPDVAAFYAERSANEVWPRYYLTERLFDLGPMSAGEVLEVEFLSHVASKAELFDGEFTRLALGDAHDFEGHRRVLEVSITRQSHAFFLRVLLEYLSEDGSPIVRLTRTTMDDTPEQPPQSVVLDFSGRTSVVYRWGNVLPTDVAPFDNFEARVAAIQTFQELFGPYNLIVSTDMDPPPEEPFSIIYIGAASPRLGGEAPANAEWTDGLNQFQDDIAVVDTSSDVFRLARRRFGSTVFGKLIGSIASHEMGHLLGLSHVRDVDAVMSGIGVPTLGRIEQGFKRAPIYWRHDPYDPENPEYWVLGYQDSVQYLLDVLGPAEGAQP